MTPKHEWLSVTFQLLNPSTYEFTLLVYIHFFFKLCDPFIFCFMISSLILLSIADDSVLMMWEEMKCWSLQRIKHTYQFELHLQWCTAFSNEAFHFDIFIVQLPGDEDLEFFQISLWALFIRMFVWKLSWSASYCKCKSCNW